MRRSFASLIAACLLLTGSAFGQQPVIFTPFGVIPVLENYLEALRQQVGIPGMSAALVQDGSIVWERGFGFQNIASHIPSTPDTPYVVGNVSETLAAVLLLQCVEQRRFDLDDPVRRYGVELPEASVTARQLLSHTSTEGPNDTFLYSPERFAQLTALMEWCAPQPYRKSVAHRVLNRLAMRDSVPGTDLQNAALPLPEGLFDPADLERYRTVLERTAVPYKIDSRGRAERTLLPPMTMSATGGLVSTVRDLARFDAALDQMVLLTEDTTNAAWHPAPDRRNAASPMGLGWFVQSHRNKRVVWHFGHVPNAYSSLVLKLPEDNLTLILLANSDGLSAPFSLGAGDVTKSVFAALFLKLVT
ncbi:MAG TPA: serine hydrolase domain-containing protein [Vicinamibacterales bacterium]|nr:serine hydrolase domain-containing protein [Vicinamibacterales bacterium]